MRKNSLQPSAFSYQLFRIGVLALAASVAVGAARGADALKVFGREWKVYNAADWKVDQENGAEALRLTQGREPLPGPRRPFQFALTDVPDYASLTVEADAMPMARSLMIVFGYRDEAHFDYAHLSIDTGAKQPVHNGIFHVYGGERVRISSESGPAAFAASGRWYHVKLTHDARTGVVAVTVDGLAVPALKATDVSLGAGKAGIGSFDETAAFKNVKIGVSGRSTAP
jgi:hypothetical protein